MAADKYLYNNSGVITERSGTVVSDGAAKAGDIPALDDSGKLDASVIPIISWSESKSIAVSEAITSGQFVNIWDSSGLKVRPASAANNYPAHGFVLTGASSGSVTVYFSGKTNTGALKNGADSWTIGATVYLSNSTAGAITTTAPSTSGHIVQKIGTILGTSEVNFDLMAPIVLA